MPLIYEVGVWLGKDLAGDFVNRSGSGDNLAGEAVAGGAIGLLVGLLGVVIGIALRLLLGRLEQAR